MWHEARKTERKVHAYMDAAKVRAEKKAAWFASMRGDPIQSLRITGTGCKLHHDISAYRATENQEGLIAWNGKADHLIDRFDGRALLDFIREYDPKLRPPREKNEEEQELDELCNFERYKDVIKQRLKGLTDEEGLEQVEETIIARAQVSSEKDKEKTTGGKQTYARIGFSYDGSVPAPEEEANDTEEKALHGSDESSSDDSEDEEIEDLAEGYGVEEYHRLVQADKKARMDVRAAKKATEAQTEPGQKKMNRKERKKAGLLNNDKTKFPSDSARSERRNSPTYDPLPSKRRRSRSRSPSPSYRRRSSHRDRSERDGPPKTEFITEFEGSFSDLPLGPPPAPPLEKLSREGTSGPSTILEALRSDPAQLAGTGFVGPGPKTYSRPLEPKIAPSKEATSAALAKLNKISAGPAKPAGEKKETPQERLKRIMSKQLTKQIKRDTVSENEKKREADKLRQQKLEETRRLAGRQERSRSRSPHRRRSSPSPYSSSRRSRSPSPPPSRSHSRDRSRGRSHSYHRERD